METKVKDLEAKIKSGDLSAAQAAYVASRPSYEQIEVLAGSFEETDCSIDCRPDAFAKGENSPDFKGYHKLKELGTKVEDAIKDAKKCIDKYRKMGDMGPHDAFKYDDYSTMPVNGLVDGRECVVKQGYA